MVLTLMLSFSSTPWAEVEEPAPPREMGRLLFPVALLAEGSVLWRLCTIWHCLAGIGKLGMGE